MLTNKNICIFGGSGFIGHYLVQELAKTGAKIEVFSRTASRAQGLRIAGFPGQITLTDGNVLDEKSVCRAIDRNHIIINLVGILCQTSSRSFADFHYQFPARLAKYANGKTEGLIHFSALAASATSKSLYLKSKYKGEAAIMHDYPEATIIRPSVVFGPLDSFFNRFATISRLSPVMPAILRGKPKFQPVYVGDLAVAVRKMVENPALQGKIYELGGSEVVTLETILKLILQYTGRKRLILPIPVWLSFMMARVFSLLPNPPFTTDQLRAMAIPNLVEADHKKILGFEDLNIKPARISEIAPNYLV